MINKIVLFNLLLFFCFTTVFPDVENLDKNLSVRPKLVSIELFSGDRHGDFKGDPVIILSDGSRWKVHPKDEKIISRWNVDDEVKVSLRTDTYWFKREHKFQLINRTRNEKAKVMLVNYGPNPVKIIKTEILKELITIDGIYGVRIPRGQAKIIFFSMLNLFSGSRNEGLTLSAKKLSLSDGSVWIIPASRDYSLGKSVYLVKVQDSHGPFKILITGKEKEATWLETLER